MDYDQKEKELNKKILELTNDIRSEYPELEKFLEEMPITIPNDSDPHITIKNLQAYHDSLVELVEKYDEEH
jgi:hypothetical protein